MLKLIIAISGNEAIEMAENKGYEVVSCSAYNPETYTKESEVCWILEVLK